MQGMFASLYVSRRLLNATEVATWFLAQGMRTVVSPGDMHVTGLYSKQPIWWEAVPGDPETPITVEPMRGARTVEKLGQFDVVVLKFQSDALMTRWRQYREVGASHDYNGFQPHVTISLNGEGVDTASLRPFPGKLLFGPEIRRPITGDWTPDLTKEVTVEDLLDKAFVARIPAVIKARPQETGGRRIVEVQASCEAIDYDGDVVLQEALLKSANTFVATGHLDIDHLSEFGARLGIPDPSSYIVGRPLDVRAGSGRTTFVEGEISRSMDGHSDPVRNRYDEFWSSLQRDPPVMWFSSIYGWPTDIDDCTKGLCTSTGATRYVIKAIDWRSLAFTRAPKNTSLHSPTRILSAKAHLAELAKALVPTVQLPNTIEDAAQPCPTCHVHEAPSLLGYRKHFAACKGCSPEMSDILGHAVMHRHAMQRYSLG